MIKDFTKIIMLAEGKPATRKMPTGCGSPFSKFSATIGGIGGHTDWLRDFESALNTLDTDLKTR